MCSFFDDQDIYNNISSALYKQRKYGDKNKIMMKNIAPTWESTNSGLTFQLICLKNKNLYRFI